ncbi:MAG: sulfatase, partial [Planctomycetaceae bacterium]|nr:sulfatase [Planctomycetaceae bacterium]
AEKKPNIVLLFVDDLGWSDVGCYGNDFIETPHIDKLASQGMKFTNFYAAGAVCSPTRRAVQSGLNQARIGITAHIPGHWRPFEKVITPQTTMALPLEVKTVAESLKDEGYTTGYIGKWHLGSDLLHGPQHQGYDFAAVINGPHLPGKFRSSTRKDLVPKPGQYRTDFEADLTTQFIRDNKENPFFVMISPFAVHIPLGAMSDKAEKYRKKGGKNHQLPHPIYAAMVEHVDDLLGKIVAEIEAQGLTDETMVIFTSDNGGLYRRYDFQAGSDSTVTKNTPLRDEKGSLYEGGIRVPLIVKYPAMVKPSSICNEPTISYDFYPTFTELAGGDLPVNQVIDGLSLIPLLNQSASSLDREAIHFHYPHYHHSKPASAIRKGDWKLIEFLDGSPAELYNLRDDISESKNLTAQRKGMTAALKQELNKWRLSVGARMPLTNPNYDPERADQWWNIRSGKPLPFLINGQVRKPFPKTEKQLPNQGKKPKK